MQIEYAALIRFNEVMNSLISWHAEENQRSKGRGVKNKTQKFFRWKKLFKKNSR